MKYCSVCGKQVICYGIVFPTWEHVHRKDLLSCGIKSPVPVNNHKIEVPDKVYSVIKDCSYAFRKKGKRKGY